MARLRVASPPGDREIRGRTPHEIVRDFPETLSVLRSRGLKLPEAGGRALKDVLDEVAPDDPESVVRELLDAVGWREDG